MNQLGFPLYMNGQQVTEPVTITHQPAAGFGEYFTEPLGQTMIGIPAYQRPGSMLRKAAAISPLLGSIGQITEAATEAVKEPEVKAGFAIVAGLAVLGLLVRGTAGYYAGKAMAPRGREIKYAWGGVAASVLLGSLGLGIEGAIALKNR